MSLIKIKFGNNFEEEFQKAVDEVFRLVIPVFKQNECIWKPNVDVYESLDEIMVLADLAGLNKEELHIELERRKIKIAGVRKTIAVLKKGRYYLAEIPHGYFERIIFCRRPWMRNQPLPHMPMEFSWSGLISFRPTKLIKFTLQQKIVIRPALFREQSGGFND